MPINHPFDDSELLAIFEIALHAPCGMDIATILDCDEDYVEGLYSKLDSFMNPEETNATD